MKYAWYNQLVLSQKQNARFDYQPFYAPAFFRVNHSWIISLFYCFLDQSETCLHDSNKQACDWSIQWYFQQSWRWRNFLQWSVYLQWSIILYSPDFLCFPEASKFLSFSWITGYCIYSVNPVALPTKLAMEKFPAGINLLLISRRFD